MNQRIFRLLAAAILPLAGGLARAADNPGITVSATGEAKAKPTQVELNLTAAGSAELAGDAMVKYRDALRRMTSAFEALKMENLEVTEQGLSYSEANSAGQAAALAAFGGGTAPAAKPQVQISRGLQLVLKQIEQLPEQALMEKIARILDTAKDSGASQGAPANARMAMIMASMGVGQSGDLGVTFVVEDADAVRQRAYEDAFAQARARAQRLASLAGVKLGPVLSVEEDAPSPAQDKDQASMQMRMLATIYGMASSGQEAESSRITSDKYEEIPVRVALRVRFAIEPK
jgi:uncharacterized protein YggE